jgi:DNA-binding PadR family transcriptional regulator
LIERRRSPQDRRRHTVSLTPEGTRRLAEVEHALTEAEQRVLAVLDSEQQATLHALLEQVTANAVVCSEQRPATAASTPTPYEPQNSDEATGSPPGRRG